MTIHDLANAFAVTDLGIVVAGICLDMQRQAQTDPQAARHRYLQHVSALSPEAVAVLDHIIVAVAVNQQEAPPFPAGGEGAGGWG